MKVDVSYHSLSPHQKALMMWKDILWNYITEEGRLASSIQVLPQYTLRYISTNLICVHLDNCCSDRQSLQDYFGPDVQVKLDLFHAVARIMRELPKKKISRMSKTKFTHELRLCFRNSNDTDPTNRKLPTASPTEITRKLEALKVRWDSVLPPLAKKEITNLQQRHAQRGCLRYRIVMAHKFFTT